MLRQDFDENKRDSFLHINAPNGMEILSNIIRGVSCASGRFASFLILGGFMAFI